MRCRCTFKLWSVTQTKVATAKSDAMKQQVRTEHNGAQQTYERQKTENMAAVEKAEADKQVALAKAEAEAEAARIKAAADAEVIKITAEAEAKANELIAASITDAILQQKFYERWDGKLPTVMGDSTLLTEIQPEI